MWNLQGVASRNERSTVHQQPIFEEDEDARLRVIALSDNFLWK